MSDQRWKKVGELFDQALALDPGQLDAFLDEHCGDDQALRSEVVALLESEAQIESGSFLEPENVLSSTAAALQPGDPLIGVRLGVYEVRKRIGQGGMGNVYLATRVEDFKQRVAIKVLKRGMDTEDILRKFRMEIRVVAALGQHANIARLLDAGTTDDGLPYFVMEYVEGMQIDQYCDKNRLSIDERLDLAGQVANVVHFAHQHTVIHRDLKPSNVLIDVRGRPKLIDFGIAKITSPELGEETINPTRTGYRALTPEYASPEQLRGEPLTTATDVYSLGVLLFELLTGRRPTDGRGTDTERQAAAAELREPPQPSSVVLSPTETASSGTPKTRPAEEVAAQRQTTPEQLRRQLRGDLDNIVSMALRGEPKRRYASAGQLAMDIKRYLAGEQTVARPLSRTERFWRVCRRNPVPASLLVGLLLAALFGLLYLSQLSRVLVERTALQSAAQQAEMLLHGHRYYTEVLDGIKTKAPVAAAELKPPATFTIELFEFLNQSKARSGTSARLLSEYPFKPRAGRPPLDDFELTALSAFETGGRKSYYEFRDFDGTPALRYGIAMRMEQSCCDCHNTHPDSTKTDWRPGDVRGILEVIRPLEDDVERTRAGLLEAFGWMGLVLGGVFALVALLLRRH
ncbi:MAG: DUF3365 domain-containing protein [Planctomycetota bacterium]|nr:MAG: DUF3365 domain-containing protein [Planctomycetota bacterium]